MKNMIRFVGIGLLPILCGCASMESKWKKVHPGQTYSEVEEIMGDPDQIKVTPDNKYAYGWNFSAYSGCGVVMDNFGKVERMACGEDPVAKARYQAMGMAMVQNQMMMNQQMQQQNAQMLQNTVIRRPTSTNCTTNMIGGTAYTHCNGY